MNNFGKFLLLLAVLLSFFLKVPAAEAQLVPVTETYRVVVVDRAEQKIGIARINDSPDVRQNWVYIKDHTEIVHRIWRDQEFRDEEVDWNEFFRLIKKGHCIRVHGGRNLDMSIDAKSILF
ncbi:hypothetical protein IJT93_09770 [bacterium]|nr:hypothetical protein [bacterium]